LFELLRDESSEGKKRKEEKKTDTKAAAPKAAPKKGIPIRASMTLYPSSVPSRIDHLFIVKL